MKNVDFFFDLSLFVDSKVGKFEILFFFNLGINIFFYKSFMII